MDLPDWWPKTRGPVLFETEKVIVEERNGVLSVQNITGMEAEDLRGCLIELDTKARLMTEAVPHLTRDGWVWYLERKGTWFCIDAAHTRTFARMLFMIQAPGCCS